MDDLVPLAEDVAAVHNGTHIKIMYLKTGICCLAIRSHLRSTPELIVSEIVPRLCPGPDSRVNVCFTKFLE